jgi:hypothetical protein
MSKAIELLVKDAKELLEASAFETRKKDEKKQIKAKESVKKVVQKFIVYASSIKIEKDKIEVVKSKFDEVGDKIVAIIDDNLSEDKMMVNFIQRVTKVLLKNLDRIKKEQAKLEKVTKVPEPEEEKPKKEKRTPKKDVTVKKSVKNDDDDSDYEYQKKEDEKHLKELGYMTCSDKECSCWDFTDFDDLSSTDCSSSDEEEVKTKSKVKPTKICVDGKCKPKVIQFDEESKTKTPEPTKTDDVFVKLFKTAVAKIESAPKEEADKLIKALKAKYSKLSKQQQEEFREDMELIELVY